MINKLINIFKRKEKFVPYPNKTDLGNIVVAFNCGGKTYYTFEDESKMPVTRWFEVLDLLEMLDNRMSRERLQAHCEYISDMLNKGAINKVVLANEAIKENLLKCVSPAVILRLASIMYFDSTESLYATDPAYNEKKIAYWVKAGGVDFFLQLPIRKYLPSNLQSEADLEVYLKLATAETKLSLLTVLQICKSDGLPKETLASLQWEVETLTNLQQSLDSASGDTTNI